MKKLILAVAIVAFTSGSGLAQAPAPMSPHQLTAAEIRAAYVGNVGYGAGRFGPKTSSVYFAPDGQIRMRSPDMNDSGTYRITDDGMYCSKFHKLRDGVEACQTIWQTGPNAYESHYNGRVTKVTIVAGNPDGL
jgi:hypothetical protein